MIVLYKGARGKGKTLSMVKDGLIFFKNGYNVLSNFDVKYAKQITNEEILNLNKNSNIFKSVLLIDEIQIFFDSRRSMKAQNMNFSNFIQQIRKRGIIMLVTSQYSNTIDLRLRQHLDVIAKPNFIKEYDLCKVDYIDLTSMEDDFNLKPLTRTIIFNAKPIYKLYNTEEMIK